MTALSTPTAPAPTPRPGTFAPTGGGGGVKETVESILVAFILAFVFRAFVVEAFVIPTGSMATTLLGAHTRFQCPDCGYAFDLNYSDPRASEDDDVPVPATAGPLKVKPYCPNCGFLMPPEQTANPPVAYGDRILVLKYLYLLQDPKRWDVVVFKAPTNPNQNFIKRLIGRPGEAIMILDGDVYVRPPGDTDPKHFTVQPKPAGVQDAMWRLIYDNDYHPAGTLDRSGVKWQQPWRLTEGTGCQQDDTHGRAFTFDNPSGTVKLTYDPHADPSTQGPNDYLVYDQNTLKRGRFDATGAYTEGEPAITPRSNVPGLPTDPDDFAVSDLDVRLTYQRTGGAGPFAVAMTKRDHTFTAELTATTATLYHDVGGRRTAIGSPVALPANSRPVRVELSNADYQVTLRINDSIVVQSTPADYAPDFDALIREYYDQTPAPSPTVTIRADQQQARVSHLSLWRDVYYYNRSNISRPAQGIPDHVQQLGADEFFTMGDNSEVSWDARCWDRGVHLPKEGLEVSQGKVPGRFLLGRAFYVYWPAGYRATSWLPSLVPNFAGMRLIH